MEEIKLPYSIKDTMKQIHQRFQNLEQKFQKNASNIRSEFRAMKDLLSTIQEEEYAKMKKEKGEVRWECENIVKSMEVISYHIFISSTKFTNPYTDLPLLPSLLSIPLRNFPSSPSFLSVLPSTHCLNENVENLAIFDPGGIKSSSLPFLKSKQPNLHLHSLSARQSAISLSGVLLMHLLSSGDTGNNIRGAIVEIFMVNRHRIEAQVSVTTRHKNAELELSVMSIVRNTAPIADVELISIVGRGRGLDYELHLNPRKARFGRSLIVASETSGKTILRYTFGNVFDFIISIHETNTHFPLLLRVFLNLMIINELVRGRVVSFSIEPDFKDEFIELAALKMFDEMSLRDYVDFAYAMFGFVIIFIVSGSSSRGANIVLEGFYDLRTCMTLFIIINAAVCSSDSENNVIEGGYELGTGWWIALSQNPGATISETYGLIKAIEYLKVIVNVIVVDELIVWKNLESEWPWKAMNSALVLFSLWAVLQFMQPIGFLGLALFLTQLSHVNSPARVVLCKACSQGHDAFSILFGLLKWILIEIITFIINKFWKMPSGDAASNLLRLGVIGALGLYGSAYLFFVVLLHCRFLAQQERLDMHVHQSSTVTHGLWTHGPRVGCNS